MYLVVGLGNPGPRYEDHRHNVGFMVLAAVARRAGASIDAARYDGYFAKTTVAGETTGLLLPQTYMNRSGDSVAPAARFFKVPPEQILVVHDELDLPYGTLRLKSGGGLAGHNGLKSIAERLGTQDFLRLRFGVGRPPPPLDAAAYVLSAFSAEEARTLPDHLDRAAEAVRLVLAEGLKAAMSHLHVRQKPDPGLDPGREPQGS
ncbi:MAG: aminoacyl-tRNA hydrolase [Deltaproteobacteria bacterium]|nr:aminoacyl-tRNA hydrolase [Deltaproteobacteria bacterium]